MYTKLNYSVNLLGAKLLGISLCGAIPVVNRSFMKIATLTLAHQL